MPDTRHKYVAGLQFQLVMTIFLERLQLPQKQIMCTSNWITQLFYTDPKQTRDIMKTTVMGQFKKKIVNPE